MLIFSYVDSLMHAERTVVFIEACTADYVYHFIKITSILYRDYNLLL
ncbi:hypothetical protein APHWI1_1567 [Anaplasma phagocytophilum str. ApWI1]|uniref:Uncharacterized protein n=1 Tax=Anaplasma phagocytophilum str. ApWI1 TaxID=1359155 RepID=A0A0F3PVW4_ANAPH|nr:hypothetical protein APHWEB_1535 [Anaplasma phagocytophilum str. Webster]KJV84137.1 hypothetical protein APHWI1_1568 [Anaplasma phagocytophilum str. ApWI1]KJV87687.1 hypothetical protein APHNYW_0516 [Anaplasma phagocytophilum str. ApNYW]KJZ98387.1 hypothetical protein APHCR_0016 [Anaplasma phagocytophilum str. CR1007]KJV60220.1 hypothetical protein APHWEB_1537 [Anaplasma phagocytophilum str. Webster]